jgi:hypothetical protein
VADGRLQSLPYPWGAPRMIALLAGGLAMLIAFTFAESRAQDPILPFTPPDRERPADHAVRAAAGAPSARPATA